MLLESLELIFFQIQASLKRQNPLNERVSINRSGGIRTHDLYSPKDWTLSIKLLFSKYLLFLLLELSQSGYQYL